jgi:hypothetical protein
MKIYSDEQTIREALDNVNRVFDNNIKFKRLDVRRNHCVVTLGVISSKEAGSRRSHIGRRIAAACWHAHGHLFDWLPPDTKIVSLGRKFTAGDPWHNWNVGSQFQPIQMSETCDCCSECDNQYRCYKGGASALPFFCTVIFR